ncbi:hypothetical protein GQ607_017775, partial [Colletotrichum asianum]
KPKTLAIIHHSNSKIARKPTEQLNEILQVQQFTFREGESSPYNSDKPHNVTQQHAQTETTFRFTPNIDNSSSEEESNNQGDRIKQLLKYQEINILQDKQQHHFYSTPADQQDQDYTPQLHTEDHPTLRSNHQLHQTLF